MPYTVEILGVDKTSLVKKESLNISMKADNRNECSLSLISTASAMGSNEGFVIGQDLKVKDSGVIIFGGVISSVSIKRLSTGLGNTQKIQIDISSSGYWNIPTRRTTTESFTGKSAGYIVGQLITNILSQEGITAGTIGTGADPVGEGGEYDAICKSCSEILDDMANASGYKWYIDSSRQLHFIQDDAITDASHDITENGAFQDFNVQSVEVSMEYYRNKQFVRGGLGDTGSTVTPTGGAIADSAEITARQAAEGGAIYSSGVYGNVINDDNIETTADADTAANNALKRYGVMPYSLSFESMTNDWRPGKKLKVNLPVFGISSDSYFLIEEVTLEDIDGKNLKSTVKATRRKELDFSTQRTENYQDYFQKLIKSSKGSKGGNVNPGGGSGGSLYLAGTANAAQVVVNTSDTELCSITLDLKTSCKLPIMATVYGTCSDALRHTLTIKVDSVEQKTGQTAFYGAESHDQSIKHEGVTIAAGSRTVKLYGKCDAGTFTVAPGAAVLIVGYSLEQFQSLYDVTGFDTTVASSTQINLGWTNPTADNFTEVEVYRSTSDILTKDRTYCAANATKIYNGTGTSKNDTGLSEGTTYYYRIFAVYTISNIKYYSAGVGKAENTTESLYQQWTTYTDSPILTSMAPYQFIADFNVSGEKYLFVSKSKIYKDINRNLILTHTPEPLLQYDRYRYSGSSWIEPSNSYGPSTDYFTVLQANYDIYNDESLTTVYFVKTT